MQCVKQTATCNKKTFKCPEDNTFCPFITKGNCLNRFAMTIEKGGRMV